MDETRDDGTSEGDGPDQHREPSLDFETVYVGPLTEVLVLQTALEGNGIRAFIADQNTKAIDPFITGISPLDARLQVPQADVPAAATVLAELREGRDPPAAEAGGHLYELDLEQCARRVRWAAVLALFAPLGVLYGITYYLATGKQKKRASAHGLTMAGFWLCIVWTAAILFAYLFAFQALP